ncbi:hypothetical protein [Caulobacter endophyticus]|uniref:Uncharacterized protein n=1 Tax=Caulobacter endophyticus TaxID=2172652 RepID=A0A2T9JNF4_9CAUL|nr:hypothetical protein [Caulobacter endophyticus]PVM85249.1 hypothetical protein DDF67_18135 [Caulobacter endophyticus]
MTRPDPILNRAFGWSLLALGLAAGVVLPHPATTALWSASARAFRRAGDEAMVQRLLSATKFGPRIRRGLKRPTAVMLYYGRAGLA